MQLLHALSYLAGTVGFLFVLLSLASGLLYIAEVIEEHAGAAKTIGQRAIYVIIFILIALHVVDGLPLQLTALGVVSHLVYLQNFSRSWPVISLTSPIFLASCVLVIVSHFVSFQHFSHRSTSQHGYGHYAAGRGRTSYSAHSAHHGESFMDVATYFALLVWLVPFYLFLSLSANDNVLPSATEIAQSPSLASSTNTSPKPAAKHRPPPVQVGGGHQRKHSSVIKKSFLSAFSLVPNSLKPASRGGMSAQREGLIASPVASHPPSPIPGGNFDRFQNGMPSPSLGASQGWGAPGVAPPPRSPVLGGGSPYLGGGGFPDSSNPAVSGGNSLRAPSIPIRRHTSDEIPYANLGGSPDMTGLGFQRSESPSLGGVGWGAQDGPSTMMPSRSPRLGTQGGIDQTAQNLMKRK